MIGEAIASSGPSIVFSFVLAGITCAFSALCYAELLRARRHGQRRRARRSIPVAGSAYTYAYAPMGELVAWIIGGDLILGYGVSVALVAVGWGEYLYIFLDTVYGYSLPESIAGPPGEGRPGQPAGRLHRARDHDPAGLRRARERPRHSIMVLVKIAALLMCSSRSA